MDLTMFYAEFCFLNCCCSSGAVFPCLYRTNDNARWPAQSFQYIHLMLRVYWEYTRSLRRVFVNGLKTELHCEHGQYFRVFSIRIGLNDSVNSIISFNREKGEYANFF